MELLKELIAIDREADQAIYLQISNSFVHNIRRGRFRTGLKLPGSRKAAELLNINRMTMVAAYDELQAQGWIERIPRKGTFVRHDLPEIEPKRLSEEKRKPEHLSGKAGFPFYRYKPIADQSTDAAKTGELIINDGFPDVRLAPMRALFRAMRRISGWATAGKYLGYGSAQGTMSLRKSIAADLNISRGLPVTEENVIVTRGAQMAFYLASRLLIRPGDHVVVGEPGFFGVNRTLQQQGAVLNRVSVDQFGLNVDEIEKICKKQNIKLLYVIPHHHHPTTVTLSPDRRIRLLELASKYKFAILEDDYDYDFHYASSPMLPMASLDENGTVIYTGTLSKTLAPGIRIGFLAAPREFILHASHLRRSVDWQGDSLMEAALAELYEDGTIARHIKKSVKLYRERRDHFCTLLAGKLGDAVSFTIPDGGMSVWVKFNRVNLLKLSQKAAEKGLVMSNGQEYNTDTKNYNSLRMGFASLNFEEQEKAVDILRECIAEG